MALLGSIARATLFTLLGACTIKSSSTPLDVAPDTETPDPGATRSPDDPSTITGSDGEPLDLPSASPDQGTSPADRPNAAPGGTIRTCDTPLREAKATRRSRVYTKTNPIKLGAAVIDGKANPATLWALGIPQAPTSTNLQSGGDMGPDLTKLSWLLGWNDDAAYDLFQTHVGGKNALQIWADTIAPTSRRMTYAYVTNGAQQAYRLASEKRADAAPTGTDDKYVRSMSAMKGVGVAFVVTTASDCATGALADLLKRRPIVREGFGNESGTLFDPAKRAEIQNLLVRDGAELMVAEITTRADETLDKIVKETTCSATDLTACEKTLTDLIDAANKFMKNVGAPTYETLSAGTDANWAFTTFVPGDVASLK